MKRRRSNNMLAAVSLFPFLAVLICTFGVLIVLLVLVVKSADEDKKSRIASENSGYQAQLFDLENTLGLQNIRIEGLTELRPKLIKDLEDERTVRAHLNHEIKVLQERLTLHRKTVERLRSREKVSVEQIASTADELKATLAERESELDELLQQAEFAQQTTYSILPYNGNNGTNRRPIYIECAKDRLILQPHGIEIARGDFANVRLPGNPLDAALIAVREYFIKLDLVGDKGFPYPLLVVRPEGAESYVMARHAMSSWDDEFGYELVSGDKAIDFGAQDPQLSEAIEEAIDESKKRFALIEMKKIQERAFQSRNRFRSGGSGESRDGGGGLRASNQFGGFVNQKTGVKATSHQQQREAGGDEVRNASDSGDSNQFAGNSRIGATDGQSNSQSNGNSATGSSSIANERGEGWALPTRSPGAVGYLRPVRIYCEADRLTVDSAQGDGITSTIVIGDDPQEAVVGLVETLWKKIDAWGLAGVNGFWRPHLKVFVMPGAQTRFAELKGLLKDSGLEVEAINE